MQEGREGTMSLFLRHCFPYVQRRAGNPNKKRSKGGEYMHEIVSYLSHTNESTVGVILWSSSLFGFFMYYRKTKGCSGVVFCCGCVMHLHHYRCREKEKEKRDSKETPKPVEKKQSRRCVPRVLFSYSPSVSTKTQREREIYAKEKKHDRK
jgi:hypothetical protein